MHKNLKVVLLPTILLILIVGCLVPICHTLMEERCNLAFMSLVESDLLAAGSADLMIAKHSDSMAYLMNHPRQTLKICLAYEAENPGSDNAALVYAVAAGAYAKATGEMLPENKGNLKETIQARNPELYGDLRAE